MAEDQILYHYCTNETFVKIINNRSIRLSSLDAANDWQEGRWLIHRLRRVLELRGVSSASNIDFLISQFEQARSGTLGLSFCMSRSEDLLSQWRGYADDGAGVAVGISRLELVKALDTFNDRSKKALTVVLAEIEYNEDKADEWLSRWVDEYNENAHYAGRLLGQSLFMYKNPVFIEEREWRVLSMTALADSHSDAWRRIEWMGRSEHLVPYWDISFESSKPTWIKEVWLGPKNKTNQLHLAEYIRQNGLSEILVKRSAATYR